jgi:hypothetical protein
MVLKNINLNNFWKKSILKFYEWNIIQYYLSFFTLNVINFLNVMFQNFKNIVQTYCEIKTHIQI